MTQKYWPIFNTKLLNKMGQDFLEIQNEVNAMDILNKLICMTIPGRWS